jgi:hypothetical protein
MPQYLCLGQVSYDQGQRLQTDISALLAKRRVQNMLLEHSPARTWGRNANRANVLASAESLARSISIRGGQGLRKPSAFHLRMASTHF